MDLPKNGFFRSLEPAFARPKNGDQTTTLAITLLILQVSTVVALTSKTMYSEIGNNILTSTVGPSLIPIFVWITYQIIRQKNNTRHLIQYMPLTSVCLYGLGLISLAIVYMWDEGLFFPISHLTIIFSTSIMIVSVSDNLDDLGFDWNGLTNILIGKKDSGLLAVVPMVGPEDEETSIVFKGASKVKRNHVKVEKKSNYYPLEYRTRNLGYIQRAVERNGNKEWNPVTIAGLYEHASEGFSMGAAGKIEAQSLATLMLTYLSNASRWEVCGLPTLLSGEASAKIEDPVEGKPPIIVRYKWTEEEVKETSEMILRSVAKGFDRESVSFNLGRENEPSKKPTRLFDMDGDGKVDWADVRYFLDQNKDGKVTFDDLLLALGIGRTGRNTRLALQEAAGLVLIGVGPSSTINKHLTLAYLVCLSSLSRIDRRGISSTTWREICSFFPLLAKTIIDKVGNSIEPSQDGAVHGNFGDHGIEEMDKRTPDGLWKIQPHIIEKYQDMVIESGSGEIRPVVQFTQRYDELLLKVSGKTRLAVDSFFDECLTLITSLMINRIDTEPFGITSRDLLEKRKGTVIASSLILEVMNDYIAYFKNSGGA